MQLYPFRRYQSGLSIQSAYPMRTDGKCACGCDALLSGRRTRWATNECQRNAVEQFRLLKGDGQTIRRLVWERDKGVCRGCGLECLGGRPFTPEHLALQKDARRGKRSLDTWEADHIIPVERGGAACGLDNIQTLCVRCHRQKTAAERAKPLRNPSF